VAGAIADAIGKEKVGIRLSPYGVFNDLPLYDEVEATYNFLATELGNIGILYIHIVDHSSMGTPPVPLATKAIIRDLFGGTIILNGGYDKARAEADLASGLGHLVSFGRPFLANPDLVTRFKQDAPLQDPDHTTFYTPGEKGYTDYPVLTVA
jgi:N-ethylmaleimide reductase